MPLGGLDFTEAWSLVSLVLALLGLVGSVAVGLALLLRRRKAAQQDETPPRRGTVLGLGGVVLGLLAGVLFLALDKLSAPMVFINRWTPLIAAALLVHVAAAILYLLARRQEKQQGTLYDDDEAGPPAHEGG